MQIDMFTGEIVDNRTKAQKKREKQLQAPQQQALFTVAETVEIGRVYKPAPDLEPEPLTLEIQDGLTPEERAMEEARRLTFSLPGIEPTKE